MNFKKFASWTNFRHIWSHCAVAMSKFYHLNFKFNRTVLGNCKMSRTYYFKFLYLAKNFKHRTSVLASVWELTKSFISSFFPLIKLKSDGSMQMYVGFSKATKIIWTFEVEHHIHTCMIGILKKLASHKLLLFSIFCFTIQWHIKKKKLQYWTNKYHLSHQGTNSQARAQHTDVQNQVWRPLGYPVARYFKKGITFKDKIRL